MKEFSHRIHANRSYAQVIALLAVCMVKGLAISTIVCIDLNVSIKYCSPIDFRLIYKSQFHFQFVFLFENDCNYQLTTFIYTKNNIINPNTECDYNVAINVCIILTHMLTYIYICILMLN